MDSYKEELKGNVNKDDKSPTINPNGTLIIQIVDGNQSAFFLQAERIQCQ